MYEYLLIVSACIWYVFYILTEFVYRKICKILQRSLVLFFLFILLGWKKYIQLYQTCPTSLLFFSQIKNLIIDKLLLFNSHNEMSGNKQNEPFHIFFINYKSVLHQLLKIIKILISTYGYD